MKISIGDVIVDTGTSGSIHYTVARMKLLIDGHFAYGMSLQEHWSYIGKMSQSQAVAKKEIEMWNLISEMRKAFDGHAKNS